VDNVAFVSLSRQMTLQKQMDIIANNIANEDTAGFKVEQLMVHTQTGAPAKTQQIKGPVQFVIDGGVGRDFSAGEFTTTGRPLDVAIDGAAFLKVSTPSGERYTRDGRLAVDAQGRLVTQTGAPILDDSGAEITLDPNNGEPMIAPDGVVSQRSAQGPQGVRVGKIGTVRFDTLSVLEKEGNNLYANTSNIQPQAAPDARLRQGVLEASNVKPIVEITNLIQVQRAYERLTQMIQQTTDLSQSSIDRLARVA
jgi:flagellar basal-body rod protein FlgF